MRSILMIFTNVCYARTCAHDEHMDDISLHTHTHIHSRYGDFLVNAISVGLASACPNDYTVDVTIFTALAKTSSNVQH